jgi:hypothetical protein
MNPSFSHWNLSNISGSPTDLALFTLDEQYTKTALLGESIQVLFCQAPGLPRGLTNDRPPLSSPERGHHNL